MYSSTITITPELAQEYLSKNISKNRPIRQSVVHDYAAQMKRGEWKITPQGIAFDVKGRLIDGQHRLAAVIESGCNVPMYVTTGVPEDRMMMIDCGVKRTMSDVLTIANPKLSKLYNRQMVAAAVELMRMFGISNRPSVTETGDYIKNRPGVFFLLNHLRARSVNYNGAVACLIGCMSAVLNGVPLSVVEDFMRTTGFNEIGDRPYNYRAALDYKDYLLTVSKGHREKSGNAHKTINEEKRIATQVAIFKFVNNRKTYRAEEEPYPITDEMLQAFVWNKR